MQRSELDHLRPTPPAVRPTPRHASPWQADLDRGELNPGPDQAFRMVRRSVAHPPRRRRKSKRCWANLGRQTSSTKARRLTAWRRGMSSPPGETLRNNRLRSTTFPGNYWRRSIASPVLAPCKSAQELKVMQGLFSAIVDLGKRRMTLMLDRSPAPAGSPSNLIRPRLDRGRDRGRSTRSSSRLVRRRGYGPAGWRNHSKIAAC